jgi:PIN domain nuclease of toxin-antitoxin system
MQFLADTHILIWWWSGDDRLPGPIHEVLSARDAVVYVSAASALEIAIKVRIGRLPQMEQRITQFHEGVRDAGFHHLMVRQDHAVRAGLLPGEHRDPFDRLIAAQALTEELVVITRDRQFAAFGCKTLW